MKNLLLKILVLTLIGFINPVYAIDLGKRAASFAIKEEGFVSMMIRKLKTLDLEKENEKMQKLAQERVENPTPVTGIKPATESREFLWDPTYTLDEDAVLPCGKILHKAGTRVNPLDYMSLDRRLWFIDGRERSQIEWLKEHLSQNKKDDANQMAEGSVVKIEDRVILVGGSVFDLQDELVGVFDKEIYFDQSGELTTKFGIKASPAVAQAEGKMLKVVEVAVEDEGRIEVLNKVKNEK